jgi:hypothetical protein
MNAYHDYVLPPFEGQRTVPQPTSAAARLIVGRTFSVGSRCLSPIKPPANGSQARGVTENSRQIVSYRLAVATRNPSSAGPINSSHHDAALWFGVAVQDGAIWPWSHRALSRAPGASRLPNRRRRFDPSSSPSANHPAGATRCTYWKG